MQKPKILIALSRFPYPATDGTRYKILHNISDALKRDFELEYFVVTFNAPKKSDLEYFEKTYGTVHLFKISFISFLVRSVRSLWRYLPFQVTGFSVQGGKDWVKDNIENYNAVYAHTIRVADYFADLPETEKKKVVFDFNDAISLNYQNAKKKVGFPFNVIYFTEENRVRAYEKKLLGTFKYFNVVSPFDREYLLSLVLENVRDSINFSNIPHGVADSLVKPRVDFGGNAIYFIGALNYDLNKDAVRLFLNTLWKPLKQKIPDLKFYVIGKRNKYAYAEFNYMKDVVFTGFLEDQYSVISKCSCLVAPLRSSGGVPSKIIEAMAYGMPVVTTPAGVRGIGGLENKQNILIIPEEKRDEWVSTIASLIKNETLKKSVGMNAQKLISEKYLESSVQGMWRSLFSKFN